MYVKVAGLDLTRMKKVSWNVRTARLVAILNISIPEVYQNAKVRDWQSCNVLIKCPFTLFLSPILACLPLPSWCSCEVGERKTLDRKEDLLGFAPARLLDQVWGQKEAWKLQKMEDTINLVHAVATRSIPSCSLPFTHSCSLPPRVAALLAPVGQERSSDAVCIVGYLCALKPLLQS